MRRLDAERGQGQGESDKAKHFDADGWFSYDWLKENK
jgi:hypothetical protein